MVGIVQAVDPLELERFKVDSLPSIITVFQQLMRKSVPVYLCTGEGQRGESRVLNVDPAHGTILLAYSPDYALNQAILEHGAYVVAEHFSAQVQFFVRHLAQVMYQQGHVFTISIPREIFRIQRRESFRAQIAIENHLQCDIPIGTAGKLSIPLADISRGGLCMVDQQGRLPLVAGHVLQKCKLELPSIGKLEADLEVKNRYTYFDQQLAHKVARIGCQFRSLSLGMENMLQRYIDQLEYRHRGSI